MSELRLTPITEETFERQGWAKHDISDMLGTDDENPHYFFTLPLPKDRKDMYAPSLVSNSTDQADILKEMGLKPNQFFVEIMEMDGLGFCASEEELEVLYNILTGKFIEETEK